MTNYDELLRSTNVWKLNVHSRPALPSRSDGLQRGTAAIESTAIGAQNIQIDKG